MQACLAGCCALLLTPAARRHGLQSQVGQPAEYPVLWVELLWRRPQAGYLPRTGSGRATCQAAGNKLHSSHNDILPRTRKGHRPTLPWQATNLWPAHKACSLESRMLKAVLCSGHLSNNAKAQRQGCSPDLTSHQAGPGGRRCGLHLPAGVPDAQASLTPGAAADKQGLCVSFCPQHYWVVPDPRAGRSCASAFVCGTRGVVSDPGQAGAVRQLLAGAPVGALWPQRWRCRLVGVSPARLISAVKQEGNLCGAWCVRKRCRCKDAL